MRFFAIRTVTVLTLLGISGAATAGLADIGYSRSDSAYPNFTNATVTHVDTIRLAPVFPEMASNPIPSNGAVNVSVEANLGWTPGICEGEPFEQAIYMSTDPDDLWSGFMGTTDLDFFEPDTLQNSATYYWRIDTTCTDVVFMGDTWEFTTEVPEPATLLVFGVGGLRLLKRRRTA